MCLICKEQQQSAREGGGVILWGTRQKPAKALTFSEFTVTTAPLAALNFIARLFP